MRIPVPNYTQTPNDLIDHWLPLLKEAELKVILVIIRKTFGWHKSRDRISISQLEKATGMLRQAVIKACKTLQEKGLILKIKTVEKSIETTYYEIVITEESNNSYQCDSHTPPSVIRTPPPSVINTLTKETITKETIQKKEQPMSDQQADQTEAKEKIYFDWDEKRLKGVEVSDIESWKKAFPNVDVRQFLNFIELDLGAKPSKYKKRKKILKTIIIYFQNEQEKRKAISERSTHKTNKPVTSSSPESNNNVKFYKPGKATKEERVAWVRQLYANQGEEFILKKLKEADLL